MFTRIKLLLDCCIAVLDSFNVLKITSHFVIKAHAYTKPAIQTLELEYFLV